jgi:hypothetical protein
MTNNTLSISMVSGYLESSDPFPIDFDQAWQWLGYSGKGRAKDRLIAEFIDGVDFRVFALKVKNPNGGRPVEKIMLSVDCLKCLGMMAGTAKGKEVRQYFLDCERTLKASTVNASASLDEEDDEAPDIGRDHLNRLLATKESFRSIAPAEMLDFVERAKGLIQELVPGEFDEADKSMLACIVREAVATVYFTGSVLTDRTIFTDEFLTISRKYMASTPNVKN